MAGRYGSAPRRQDGGEETIGAVAHDEALVGFDEAHEVAVAGGGAADQAARARIGEIVPRQVVAPVLVDAEEADVARVALAPVVLVGVAKDRDVGDLDQRLMAMVGAERPRLVLAEGDAGGALWIHRRQGPAPRRLGGGLPGAGEHGHAADDADEAAQIVEAIGRVVVARAVRVDALDVDDVEAVGMAGDEMAAPGHGAHDAAGEIAARCERRGLGLRHRPCRERPEHAVGGRIEHAVHDQLPAARAGSALRASRPRAAPVRIRRPAAPARIRARDLARAGLRLR
jgi:hypothetical protein